MNAIVGHERSPLEVLADPQEGERPCVATYGNGMASATSLAMLDVLNENELLANARGFSAESGGVYNSVAAALGQIPMALELFTEVLPRDRFFSPRHLASTSPALIDLSGLTRRLQTTHKLDIGAVTNDPEILVGLSRIADASRLAVRLGDVPSDRRFDVMERSASIPLAAGKTKVRTCDGAVLSPSPALAAAEAGYTHILVLANTPTEPAPWTENPFHRAVARRLTRKYSDPDVDVEQVMDEYTKLFRQHSEDLRAGKVGSAIVQVVRPHDAKHLPNAFTCNPDILNRGVQAGRNAMNVALDHPERVKPLPTYERQIPVASYITTALRRVSPQEQPIPQPVIIPGAA